MRFLFCTQGRKSRCRHSFRTHSHSGFLSLKSLCRVPCHSLGRARFCLCSFSVSFSAHFKSTPFARYSSRATLFADFRPTLSGVLFRVRSLGISPRVRSPGKNSLGRTRSLSLRQLTRKRFGTKRIIRLLPALHISYKIYQFSQCHKQTNSDKCVNNHNCNC